MTNTQPFGTVKIHFTSSKKALDASIDGRCTAGVRTCAGKVKTWIVHMLPKFFPMRLLSKQQAD